MLPSSRYRALSPWGVKAHHLFNYPFINLLQLKRGERAKLEMPRLAKNIEKRAKDSEIGAKCTTVISARVFGIDSVPKIG
jgi:hypothetical protein